MPELGRLMEGDLAWLHDRGAVFLVEDAAVEQPRADRFQISPSGPLFGQRMKAAQGEPGRIENEVFGSCGVPPEALSRGATRYLKGGRRPLRVPLADANVESVSEGLWIEFTLPPGSYATNVLAEITKADISARSLEEGTGLNE
jgi:tRNA pseudouridine13 synthase